MTRSSSDASLPSPCCSSPAEMDTVIVPMNTHPPTTSSGERLCLRKPWRHWLPDSSLMGISRSARRFATPGITRLDDRVDEINALLIRQKSALHRINGDFLEIVHRQTKCRCGRFKFPRHGGLAHQPVVGVKCD